MLVAVYRSQVLLHKVLKLVLISGWFLSLASMTHFSHFFECVTESRVWSDADRTLLLLCVLTDKAQEAYSALSVAKSKVHMSVKAAVLKAHELVPQTLMGRVLQKVIYW